MATQESDFGINRKHDVMQVARPYQGNGDEVWCYRRSAPVAAAGAAAAAVVEEVRSRPNSISCSRVVAEGKTIPVIKEVRAITGLGLKEAKDLVTRCGTIKEACNQGRSEGSQGKT